MNEFFKREKEKLNFYHESQRRRSTLAIKMIQLRKQQTDLSGEQQDEP